MKHHCKHCGEPIHKYDRWIHWNGEYQCWNQTTGVFHDAAPMEVRDTGYKLPLQLIHVRI
jgi:hypothetical protein